MTTGLLKAKRWLNRAFGGLRSMASAIGKTAVDVLYPPRCLHCEVDLVSLPTGPMLCAECQRDLAPACMRGCQRCGAPLPDGIASPEKCHHCRGESFDFETVVALDAYQGHLRDVILRLKRPGSEPLGNAMGTLLGQRRGEQILGLRPTVVVPVPMHWLRRLVRKENGPDAIAAAVAAVLHVPCTSRVLRRTRNTKPQKGLNALERRRNPIGAFAVRAAYDIRGARVLLIDDVLTTGATCHHAAKALKHGGADAVFVAVLGRVLDDRSA